MLAFSARAALILTMLACTSCSDEKAALKDALQARLDTDRPCLDLGGAIGMPDGVKLVDGRATQWEAKVMSYDSDMLRNRLNDYEKAELLIVETVESRPSDEAVLVPPQIFTIAVRPAPAIAAYLDADGRRVCRSRQVDEVLSLGEPFTEQGERFQKGRFRITETGPDFPKTPESGLQDLMLGLQTGGKQIDPTRMEVLFRLAKAGPEVVQVGPMLDQ